MVNRFDVFLMNIDASPDAKDTRPCIVISPDELNANLESVIVAPVSSVARKYPTRVLFEFLGSERAIVLDQIQTVEKSRLIKKIGRIETETQELVIKTLNELFAR